MVVLSNYWHAGKSPSRTAGHKILEFAEDSKTWTVTVNGKVIWTGTDNEIAYDKYDSQKEI